MVRNVIACIAVAGGLLAGCAPTGTANIEPGHQPTDKGLLVASVTLSGPDPGQLSYQVVRVGASGETVVIIPVNDPQFGLDWRHGDPAVQGGGFGRLAVLELPPGDYELRRGFIHVSAQESYTSRRYGYRFTIQPGKATYLGNVHVDIAGASGKGVQARTSIVDRRGRDLPLLHKKYAGIKPEQVIFPDDVEHEAVLKRSADGAPAKLEDLDRLLPRK